MFRSEFLLLQQEGYLFRSCLTQGLTALRNANLHDIGDYYSGFFHLSIGLERLMKVILIIEYATQYDLQFPQSTVLRAFGHDLRQLLAKIRDVKGPWANHPLDTITPASTEMAIVDHLNDFAKATRYFNLDMLTTGTARIDPLRRWKTILDQIRRTDVPANERRELTRYADNIEHVLANPHTIPDPFDIEAQAANWQRYFERGNQYAQAAGYASYRLLRVLDALRSVLSETTSAAYAAERRVGRIDSSFPHMTEFLSFVDAEEMERARNQTRWP